MKVLLVIILVSISGISSGLSQELPTYILVEIYPKNPTTNDSIELRTIMRTINWGWAQWTEFSVGDTIKVSNCLYSSIVLPAPYHYHDTFQIGNLDTGKHIVEIKGYMTNNYDSCVPQYQNDSTFSFKVSMPTGVESYLLNNTVSYFPNPIQQYVTIKANSYIREIQICSVFGEVYATYTFSGKKDVQLRTEHLHDGLYLLKIATANETVTEKIIKTSD